MKSKRDYVRSKIVRSTEGAMAFSTQASEGVQDTEREREKEWSQQKERERGGERKQDR
jgi:hypothetical protein